MHISETVLTREDNPIIAINLVTAEEDTFFSISEVLSETRTKNFHTRYLLTYSMNLDVTKLERSVFNFFTLLGDIGGFYGLLVSIFATLHGFVNYNNTENSLV